jgi:outer membrane protein assembly factor BamE (lipoprotein component of BamABCDE complex)
MANPRQQLSALAFLAACAHGPGASETLPRLAAALDSQVDSSAQNQDNGALVERVSNEKYLHGKTRGEVAQALGREGDPCSRHPLCSERGFDSEDWYYEVGTEGSSYVRHRPALILGFSRFGKVERSFVLRAPD